MEVMVKTNETLSIEKYQIRSYLKDILNKISQNFDISKYLMHKKFKKIKINFLSS